jgi:hypothetical protein
MDSLSGYATDKGSEDGIFQIKKLGLDGWALLMIMGQFDL